MLVKIKKQLFLYSFIILGLLQSCSVDSTLTYHKDKTISMLTNIDMKELMDFANGMENDSTSANKIKMGKYHKDWKSVYDIQMEERQKSIDSIHAMPNDSAVIAVMKKTFVKSIVDDSSKFTGISMKFDRLSPAEIEILEKKENASGQNKLDSYNFNMLKNWDGKTLVIESAELENFFSGGKSAKETTSGHQKTQKKTKEADKIQDDMTSILKLINMNFVTTCKFENKIKSIEGKHDCIKQTDPYSIQITISSQQLVDENQKFQHNDKKIIIVTE